MGVKWSGRGWDSGRVWVVCRRQAKRDFVSRNGLRDCAKSVVGSAEIAVLKVGVVIPSGRYRVNQLVGCVAGACLGGGSGAISGASAARCSDV